MWHPKDNNLIIHAFIDAYWVGSIYDRKNTCEAFEYVRQKLGILPSSHYIFLINNIKGEWKYVQVHNMVVCQGELPFSIDVKGRENVLGRGVMIAVGVLLLPSMPRGDIFDQQLPLMSTQAAPGATPILHGNFELQNHYILG